MLQILSCALLVATGASYLVFKLAGNQFNSGAKPHTAPIVVAARDLEIGTLIHPADLTMGQWAGPMPKGAAIKTGSIAGRGVVSTIYQGEPVTESRLAPPGSGGGLAATIPSGMRACAVRVNEVVGVAGFVIPGMRVDVLIAGNPPGSQTNSGPKVKTLLQNIQVLSAGTNIQKDNEGKPVQVPVVNLLVTPEQAEILSLASNETRIQLVLRNPTDTLVAKTTGTVMSNLFADGEAPVAPKPEHRAISERRPVAAVCVERPAPPPPFFIDVLNGSKRTEAKFEVEEKR
ncbi:MAG: Flp pilus assembly protein CpaB [Acidobacteriaceae bacterium]